MLHAPAVVVVLSTTWGAARIPRLAQSCCGAGDLAADAARLHVAQPNSRAGDGGAAVVRGAPPRAAVVRRPRGAVGPVDLRPVAAQARPADAGGAGCLRRRSARA